MSTFSWKIQQPCDEVESGSACSSCRRRKLRCSRETPPCSHCRRLGTKCVYDAKQKPGLRPGAIEALNQRIALLEQILLDTNSQPLVRFDKDGNVFGQNVDRPNARNEHEHSHGDGNSSYRHHVTKNGTQIDENERTGNEDPPELNLKQNLPPADILLAVVDYFCESFHHWIPFLHKARWRKQVEAQDLEEGDLIVLHAAISVVMPHLNLENTSMSAGDIESQTNLSRTLVTNHSMTFISLHSLQALVILLFNDLNAGELSRSYALVGYLTRTIDFLQLSVEQDASRSKALMKPLKTLNPTTDWTELESRRRLFWCVFLLDRYTSAITGLNTSFTAEDVDRRLPADGYYFTSEKPVSCPFFGLWNKKFAKLDVLLATHIPAQYNEGERQSGAATVPSPSTITSTSSGVDASRLGAFAYCIEATESLNQITTFFLQQCIDWQNRQDVIHWLTRFKELDLRLVRWKQLLPPRWKDSNISVDKSLVDMDPNLTLAHMTHNTSMILLHYSIAWPPVEWTSLIKLPSACSIETCHLAAIETSHIVDKFLQHTRIPFVNSHFSFCILVAAKLLLVLSQTTQQSVDPQFELLVEALWMISARWRNKEATDEYRDTYRDCKKCDMASRYAQFLEKLHEKCKEDPEYRFDLLDHSCSHLGHTPRTPLDNITSTVQAYKRTLHSSTPDQDKNKRTRFSSSGVERSTVTSGYNQSLINPYSTTATEAFDNTDSLHQPYPPRTTMLQTRSMTERSRSGAVNTITSPASHPEDLSITSFSGIETQPYYPTSEWAMHTQTSHSANDPFDALMNPHFIEMDRVITFEDANFHAFDFSSL